MVTLFPWQPWLWIEKVCYFVKFFSNIICEDSPIQRFPTRLDCFRTPNTQFWLNIWVPSVKHLFHWRKGWPNILLKHIGEPKVAGICKRGGSYLKELGWGKIWNSNCTPCLLQTYTSPLAIITGLKQSIHPDNFKTFPELFYIWDCQPTLLHGLFRDFSPHYRFFAVWTCPDKIIDHFL